jgi:hypothetical protein
MSFPPSGSLITGKNESDRTASVALAVFPADVGAARRGTGPVGGAPPDDFGRLVGLMRSNERPTASLRAVTDRPRVVREYLAGAGRNSALGQADCRYWRSRHSSVLMLLRANRLEVRGLLARLVPESRPDGPVSLSSQSPPSLPSLQAPRLAPVPYATVSSGTLADGPHLVDEGIDNDY